MYDNGVVVEIVSLAKDGCGPKPTTRAAVPMVVAIFCKCSRRDDDDDDDDETWLLNAVQVVVTVASTRAMVIDFMFDNELRKGRLLFTAFRDHAGGRLLDLPEKGKKGGRRREK